MARWLFNQHLIQTQNVARAFIRKRQSVDFGINARTSTDVAEMGIRSSVMDGRLGMLALIAGLLLGQTPAWGAPLPKPTHTSKTKFRIPFKFDAAQLKKMSAREIQLHVSQNQGETWELAQVLLPDGGKFEYTCVGEGEYWFSVKTLDGQGQLNPTRGSYDTGLIVIVDNTTPMLDMSLQQTDVGKVQLRWRASDTNLDINTLKLEYLAADSKDWQLIDVAPRSRGETSWLIGKTGVVSVRGSISDLAGNVANARTQTDVDAANFPPLKLRQIPQGKIANKSEDENVGRAAINSSVSTIAIPDPIVGEQGVNESPHKFVSQRRQTVDTPPLPRRGNNRQRCVTSRQFQVGYKLDDVGPSGIGAVELFITEDNGRKWYKYGDDPDQKSPFDVEVPHDGEYGFAIRVRSGAGLSSDPPVPGDPPAIVIAVDQTAPEVELLPIQQGQGANFNRLMIRWSVKEDHPSDKPVSLYYAASRTGPWEPISGWKEDRNSEYEWTVGLGMPFQFYVRVMVRDAAGNIGKAETSQPISVDLSRPTAQIIDVETPVISPK